MAKKTPTRQIKQPTIADECPSCRKPLLYCQCPLPEELAKKAEPPIKPPETNGRKLQMLTWHKDGYGLVHVVVGELAAVYAIRRTGLTLTWTKVRVKGDGVCIGEQHTVIMSGPRANCSCDEYYEKATCEHSRATLALRQSGKI